MCPVQQGKALRATSSVLNICYNTCQCDSQRSLGYGSQSQYTIAIVSRNDINDYYHKNAVLVATARDSMSAAAPTVATLAGLSQ